MLLTCGVSNDGSIVIEMVFSLSAYRITSSLIICN